MEIFAFKLKTQTFPSKLWLLVNDPLCKSICWDASGERILIHEEIFEAEVLFSPNQFINNLFKTKDFTSIIRQLNIYGFKKLSSDRIIPEEQLSTTSNTAKTPPLSQRKVIHQFYNPNFKRSKPGLLVNIKRRIPVKAKQGAAINGPRQSSRHCPYPTLNSHQESSAVIKNGTVLFDPLQTPAPQHYNGCEYVKESDRRPNTSQAFVIAHGDPRSSQQGSQSAVPTGLLGPFIPHSLQYSFNTPVYPFLSPQFFQKQAACYPPYGYYPAAASFVHQSLLEGHCQ